MTVKAWAPLCGLHVKQADCVAYACVQAGGMALAHNDSLLDEYVQVGQVIGRRFRAHVRPPRSEQNISGMPKPVGIAITSYKSRGKCMEWLHFPKDCETAELRGGMHLHRRCCRA
jgi:hypothetical protein